VTGRPASQGPVFPGDRSDLAGFPRLIDEFTEHMGMRSYSDRTIGNRRHMLSFLVAWLAERGITRPADVTRPVLESYQRHLFHYRKANGDPLSFRSQSQRLLAVRAFFKWAARQRHVLHNPASEIELPKAERRLPRPALTAAEAELVLAQPDLSDLLGVRDRAVLEVFYSTGIRRAELAALAITDIDHERRTLLVRQGKGKKVPGTWRRGVPAKLGRVGCCGWSRAGAGGDRCAARAPGRRRDRFQGGRREAVLSSSSRSWLM
jgi:integrase/recombinase XerD